MHAARLKHATATTIKAIKNFFKDLSPFIFCPNILTFLLDILFFNVRNDAETFLSLYYGALFAFVNLPFMSALQSQDHRGDPVPLLFSV